MDDMQYLLDAGDDYAVLYVMMTGIVLNADGQPDFVLAAGMILFYYP